MKHNEIYVLYGDKPKEMVKAMLEKTDAISLIPKGCEVGLKPNLVVAKSAASGSTTSPELAAGVIEYLQDHGFNRITILEGSWLGEDTTRAFKACGYTGLSQKYGVTLLDTKKDTATAHRAGDIDIKVCDKYLNMGFVINLPVLKGHCQTKMTCALKNMKGCIPDSEKRRFHAMGLHKPIACLNKIKTPDLTIVDAQCGDLDFEEGGNPVRMDRLFMGRDPVLIDAYAASLMGYETKDIPYIVMAEQMGVGSAKLEQADIIELNRGTGITSIPTGKAAKLARYIVEKDACSACFGSLIHALARLDEQGELSRLKKPIHIGQGFKGMEIDGMGIGNCCSKAVKTLKGCPPNAIEILELLQDEIARS